MNLSYEESLDMVADQFALEVQTSDYFSEGSTQYDPKFVPLHSALLLLMRAEL